MYKLSDFLYDVLDYYQTAREHEKVFRNVLRDLRENRETRPMGDCIPEDLETEASLDEIFNKYSKGERMGKFTITSFSRPEKTKATVKFKDVMGLSGGGAELEYLVSDDDIVTYHQPISVRLS
ncbi:MAG TPA: hypothetical protein VJK72_00025 [Candidatus Nanoarchaeia archaeon]|nr:hypothetical protein [Candidatus Nanoarchaeia archaeon]